MNNNNNNMILCDNTNLASAERMVGLRVCGNTKKNYGAKLNTMKIFLHKEKLYHCMDSSGEISVPLPDQIIKQLFGWLSTNTDLPKKNNKRKRNNNNNNEGTIVDDDDDDDEDFENINDIERENNNDIFADRKVTISESCMQGYKSAIMWLYKEKSVTMDKTTDNWLNDFIQGYK
jgi:hypothetical protein